MAFAKGKKIEATVSSGGFKKYIGVAPVKILAVNPTKGELEKMGISIQEEPVYISKNDNNVDQVRVTFYVQTDENSVDVNTISQITFFLRRQPWESSTGKVQAIDKFGRTVWLTRDELNNKQAPMYTNGPAKIDVESMRATCVGEAALVDFLKTFLGIEEVDVWNNSTKTYEPNKNLENCEASLTDLREYFKGNIKEIKEVVDLAKDNLVKVMFGVRTTDKGQYQVIDTNTFVRADNYRNTKFEKALDDYKNRGVSPNTEYDSCTLREYVDTMTDFKNNTEQPAASGDVTSDLPF